MTETLLPGPAIDKNPNYYAIREYDLRANGIIEPTSYSMEVQMGLKMAKQLAAGKNYYFARTDELFTALTLQGKDNMVKLVLMNLEIPPDEIIDPLSHFRKGSSTDSFGLPELADETLNALKYAEEQAREMGDGVVSTHHILLGIIHEGKGFVGQSFREKISDETVRSELARLVEQVIKNTTSSHKHF